jgi:hypothetical protein
LGSINMVSGVSVRVSGFKVPLEKVHDPSVGFQKKKTFEIC